MSDEALLRDHEVALDCLHGAIADSARLIVRYRLRGWDTRMEEGYLNGLLAGLLFLTRKRLDGDEVIFVAAFEIGEPDAIARAA